MSYKQSIQLAWNVPLPTPLDAATVVPVVTEFVVPAGLAAGDVVEMGAVPEGCIPLALNTASDALDTGNGLTLDFGFLSGTYGVKDNARTCGSEFASAWTGARAGGQIAHSAPRMLPKITPTGFGFKVNAGPTTLVVGATIRCTLLCTSAPVGLYPAAS